MTKPIEIQAQEIISEVCMEQTNQAMKSTAHPLEMFVSLDFLFEIMHCHLVVILVL